MAGFAVTGGFPSGFRCQGAEGRYAERTAQQSSRPTPAQDAKRRGPQGVAGQS